MRGAAGLVCIAVALAGCSEEGGTANPPGGAGGSGGLGSGGLGSGGLGSGGLGSGGSGGASGGGGACTVTTPTLARVGTTLVVPTLPETSPKRNPDLAYDDVNDVYLLVSGAAAISGTFLDPDGASLAAPFAIAETTAYTQSPRVTRGAGKLLVAWHDNRSDPAPQLRARIVSWNGSAPDLAAPDFSVSNGGQSYQEMPPALSHSETSALFLVVWQRIPGDDLRARRVDAQGALVGDEIVLTADPDWQSGAAATWSSANDEFLVTWTHAGAQGAAVHARRIKASDGSLVGDELELGTAGGTWTTQVAYLPCEDGYFAGWVAGGGEAFGLRLSASADPDGAPFPFPSGYGYPDGFAVAQHPMLHTLAAVMHGPTDEDPAVAFLASGETSSVLLATESPGDEGNFNPRIAANGEREEWMLVTSRGFDDIVVQRLGP